MQLFNDFQLASTLWYKIGGIAKYYIQANSKEDILQAVEFIQKNNIDKFFICGQGSNLIFSDEYFDGAVIQIGHSDKEQIVVKDTTIEAFAGEVLGHVIEFGIDHDLTGLEWAGGLPGTVGAAVRGNVGAYGSEIKDHLISADILVRQEDGSFIVKTFLKEELDFVYRGSSIKESKGNMIVLSARFNFTTGGKEEVIKAKTIYEEKIEYRKSHHPLEYPNCGSVFKNIREPDRIKKIIEAFPEMKDPIEKKWYGKVAAAYLIEKFGLKGYRVGDAQVSEKHALFIVNLGHAKSKDVLSIIQTIQSKFMETFGFNLEPEVEIVQ